MAGPSTPKHAAGSVAKGLEMLPRLATTPKGKGKSKANAREEEEEEFEEPIKDLFTNKCLVSLLYWQKALTVVDTSMGASVVLKKAKGKSMVLHEARQAFKEKQGAYDNCWVKNDPEGC
ncbi:hypothetical protein E4T56_gene11332 [Termitomyces sp. T112]|nr:hypothetical protein E4T56_gene11332 [Termitomyces sp. T112]